jgi:serine/threonine protein kinase
LTLPPLRHGQAIADRYELRKEIGSGGMGEVWLAHDRELDRAVALKFRGPRADQVRFEREAHAAAGLSHPNIVRIYDYGTAEGRPYLVLEHLPGGTLANRLESKGPLDDFETHAVAHDIAAALAHAHAAGIVHRDLKPSNVIFDEHGHAKLTDFGIARSSREPTMTGAGGFLGTAAYMAPEQASGETSVGPAADVYSFGVILFQMLTGRLPFEADNLLQLARKHRMSPPCRSHRSPRCAGAPRGARRAGSQKKPGGPPAGRGFSAPCTGSCYGTRDAYRDWACFCAASEATTRVQTALSGAGRIRSSCGGWRGDRVASIRRRRNDALSGTGCQSA